MSRFKAVLAVLVAMFAIGAVGASQASAHAANHGTLVVNQPAILGGGTASCDFTFNKTNWTGTSPSWSTNISSLTAVSPCAVAGISGTGVVLTKDNTGYWELTGTLSFTVSTVLGDVTCTYNMDNVFGSWVRHTGPPDWKEFTVDPSSTASRTGGGFLCPNPAEIVDGVIHTDAL